MNVASVAPFLAAALMRADAMRVLVLLRPTMARFAPSAASASAAAKPMPLVAPVIRMCLSFTAQQSHDRSQEQAGRQPSSTWPWRPCAILVYALEGRSGQFQ